MRPRYEMFKIIVTGFLEIPAPLKASHAGAHGDPLFAIPSSGLQTDDCGT